MKTSELIKNLQNLDLESEYLLSGGISAIDISKPIEINDLLFRKTSKFIGHTTTAKLPFEIVDRVEGFDCYAYKEGYTFWGVVLFELLFSNRSYVEIAIPNTHSVFKQLFVHVNRENRNIFQHNLEIEQKESYKSFKYYPQEVGKFPLANFPQNKRSILEDELPTFNFGHSKNQDSYDKDYFEKADQLIVSTSTSGLVQFAELLLDIGIDKNKQNEICLENPLYGFGGVSNVSIDARFWLPDSMAFYTDNINDLKF